MFVIEKTEEDRSCSPTQDRLFYVYQGTSPNEKAGGGRRWTENLKLAKYYETSSEAKEDFGLLVQARTILMAPLDLAIRKVSLKVDASWNRGDPDPLPQESKVDMQYVP